MSKVAKLVISGPIGKPDKALQLEGIETSVSADMVRDWLNQNAKAKEIEVEIDSNGGSVTEGFIIHDLLIKSGKKITTVGLNVKSIATVIFLAGDTRKMSKNGEFLIHNPWIHPFDLGFEPLQADDFQKFADDMKAEEKRLIDFYAEKIGLPSNRKNELETMMDKDSNMKVDDALRLGFATEIINQTSAKSKVMVYAYSNNQTNILKKYTMSAKKDENKFFDKVLSKLDQLLVTAGLKAKNTSVTLADGSKLFGDGELEEGKSIFTDAELKTKLKDGDHLLSDGTALTIKDGVIEKVLPQVAAKFIKSIKASKKPNVKNEAITLENGESIYTDGALADGVAIFSDEEMTEALEDGDYSLSDGTTFSVVDGVVTNMVAPAAQDKSKTELNALKVTNARLVKELDAEKEKNKTLGTQIQEFKAELDGMKELFNKEPNIKKAMQNFQKDEKHNSTRFKTLRKSLTR